LQDPNSAIEATGESSRQMTDSQIALLEQKVITYLTGTVKSENIERQIRSFFSSSRNLSSSRHPTKEHDFVLDFLTVRYHQIERLAKAFNDFDNKNAAAFSRLNEYLSSVNHFFQDSNKELYFDPGSGRLVFSFLTKDQTRKEARPISRLSSGERQILTLFTFLAFSSKGQGVFIVDEPELSLHPKWQHEFMSVFLGLRPEATQLILATHSPDIVGKFKKSCVSLRSAL
jgi:predicted ATPase